VVRLLLARGAAAGARDDRGKTAAEMAEEGGHTETSRLLRAVEPAS
jgi:predicted transcriptional regulator